MPEAPEIEILRVELKKEIVGQRINEIYTGPPSLFFPSSTFFKEYLPGKFIRNVRRYGKLLIIILDDIYSLFIHFGMGGILLYVSEGERKSYDFFISFSNKNAVLIKNLKYGKITLSKSDEILKNLGPDVIDDKNFTINYFERILHNKNKYIKSILLDQEIIAGIGNTYTDEILYRAKIHPKRKSKDLRKDEIERLYLTIKDVMKQAINLGGNSYEDFVDIYGRRGKVLEELVIVHHREGRECPLCKSKIEKIKIGGRDTYFCPICQT